MNFLQKQVFSYLQGISFNKTICFIIFFGGYVIGEVDAQLLEDRGKLNTIKTESRGFLFFQKKVMLSKTIDQRSTKREGVNVKYSLPVEYKSKENKVAVRTSAPVSYPSGKKVVPRFSSPVKENFISRKIAEQLRSNNRNLPLPTSGPSYGKGKFSLIPNIGNQDKVKPRFSKPVRENFISGRIAEQQRNNNRYPPLPTSGPSYGKGKFSLIPNFKGERKFGKPRNSESVKENFITRRIAEQLKNKRRLPPTPDASFLFGKPKFTLVTPYVTRRRFSISKGMEFDAGIEYNKYVRFRDQLKPLQGFTTVYQGDHNIKIRDNARPSKLEVTNRYGKSRLSLIPKFDRKNFSISGGMDYNMNRRLADQFKPIHGLGSDYRGNTKVKVPILAAIQKRIGQWERSSYKGHDVGWNKWGKPYYFKTRSNDIAQDEGLMIAKAPFIAGIYKKIKDWEYYSYKGRTVGLNELGKKAFLRGKAIITADFEGIEKVKKHKGGDPHPSIAYISGKRFTNHQWKERWRKMNILWVRVNPGKETSEGSQVKVKTKYDKEERDIWTY
ncbi:MAG: hypothetical protein O2887_01840 [Bacteroidetes bacterium]|nr:hypothetical protein [Bacteroidota bacterium]